MLRLLGGLGLVAPVGLGVLLIAMPEAVQTWLDGGTRTILAAIVGASIGVSLTAVLVFTYVRLRFLRLIRAAERIGAGESGVVVKVPKGGLEGRLGRALEAVATAMTRKEADATTDELTGVANRQALMMALWNEVERSNRYGRPLSVAFVDIDHFKAVNDTYGHAVGDVVLREVAQAIKKNLRGTDVIGRYGGEEFMLLLAETGVEDGTTLAEKLRQLIERLVFSVPGNPRLTVTISIGIAGGTGGQLRFDTLVRDADAAMYSAKSLGRNQTFVFAEPDEDARVPRAPISAVGRARALEVGRTARDAATAALAAAVAGLPSHRGQPSAVLVSAVTTMARQLDLPEKEIDRLRLAALLHDVGKLAVPDEILDKPTVLTSTEWRSVVQHPRIGQVILEQASSIHEATPIILHHHERFAGHGYPFGLRGNDIPLGARIVAIADAYDAMTSERPYKRAMTHEQAIAELRRHAGTQFDPDLITLFCDLYARRGPEPDRIVLALMGAARAHGQAGIAGVLAASAENGRRRRPTKPRPPEDDSAAG